MIKLLVTTTILLLSAAPAIFAQDAAPENQNQQEEAETAEAAQALPREAELPGGVDGSFLLLPVNTTDWRIISVAGEGASSAVNGSTIRLRRGGRYHIDLRGVNSDVLPLDVRSITGSVLISQRENVGTLEMEGVDPQVSSEGITFTLTEELASRIATYRAAPYPAMVGFVSVVPEEGAAGGESPENGGGETTEGAGGAEGGEEG